jgi:hypothetical protein
MVVDGLDPGADYSVSVFPLTESGTAGKPESVTMRGTDLALSVPRSASRHHRITVTVRLRVGTTGHGLGHRRVALYGRVHGHRGGYRLLGTFLTRARTGRATVTLKITKALDFIARFNGASRYIGSAAGPRHVRAG